MYTYAVETHASIAQSHTDRQQGLADPISKSSDSLGC